MAKKPIDKDYLMSVLKEFDKQVVQKKYVSSETVDTSNLVTVDELKKAIEDVETNANVDEKLDEAQEDTIQKVKEYVNSVITINDF